MDSYSPITSDNNNISDRLVEHDHHRNQLLELDNNNNHSHNHNHGHKHEGHNHEYHDQHPHSHSSDPNTYNAYELHDHSIDIGGGGHHGHSHNEEKQPLSKQKLGDLTAERKRARLSLLIALVLTTIFMVGEVVGGYFANSLAIMSDAAHLLTDICAMLLSLFAMWVASRPPTSTLSFGFHRAEILGALVSILMIWGLTGALIYEGIDRILNPPEKIDGMIMFIVGCAGLFINIVDAFILHWGAGGHGHSHGGGGHSHGGGGHAHKKKKSKKDHSGIKIENVDSKEKKKKYMNINLHSAYIHVLGDCLQSVGVMIASVIIWVKPSWKLADPITTFIFSVIVLVTTIKLLKQSIYVLMEAVPSEISVQQVKGDLHELEGVTEVHDLHIWSITLGKPALSVHLSIAEGANPDVVLQNANKLLSDEHSIAHTTIQIERANKNNECSDNDDDDDVIATTTTKSVSSVGYRQQQPKKLIQPTTANVKRIAPLVGNQSPEDISDDGEELESLQDLIKKNKETPVKSITNNNNTGNVATKRKTEVSSNTRPRKKAQNLESSDEEEVSEDDIDEIDLKKKVTPPLRATTTTTTTSSKKPQPPPPSKAKPNPPPPTSNNLEDSIVLDSDEEDTSSSQKKLKTTSTTSTTTTTRTTKKSTIDDTPYYINGSSTISIDNYTINDIDDEGIQQHFQPDKVSNGKKKASSSSSISQYTVTTGVTRGKRKTTGLDVTSTQTKEKTVKKKQPTKKELIEEMVIIIEASLHNAQGTDDLERMLTEEREKAIDVVTEEELKYSIRWVRRNKEREEYTDFIILKYPPEYLYQMIKNDNFITTIAQCKEMYPQKRFTLMVEGLDAYMRKVSTQIGAQIKKGNQQETFINPSEIAKQFVRIQLDYKFTIRKMEKREDILEYLVKMTDTIALLIFRDEQELFEGFCADAIKKKGKGLTDIWINQLSQINGISIQIARSIVSVYPTIDSLMKAYSKKSTGLEKESMLKNLKIETINGERNLGSSISSRIYHVFNSTDPTKIVY
eukprot:gene3831-4772_t